MGPWTDDWWSMSCIRNLEFVPQASLGETRNLINPTTSFRGCDKSPWMSTLFYHTPWRKYDTIYSSNLVPTRLDKYPPDHVFRAGYIWQFRKKSSRYIRIILSDNEESLIPLRIILWRFFTSFKNSIWPGRFFLWLWGWTPSLSGYRALLYSRPKEQRYLIRILKASIKSGY